MLGCDASTDKSGKVSKAYPFAQPHFTGLTWGG